MNLTRLVGLVVLDEQRFETRLDRLGAVDDEHLAALVVLNNRSLRDSLGQRLEGLDRDVVPDVGVFRVERTVVFGSPCDCLLGGG